MNIFIKTVFPTTMVVNIGTAVTKVPVKYHETAKPQRSVAILVFQKLLIVELFDRGNDILDLFVTQRLVTRQTEHLVVESEGVR